eukprot:3569388-Pyramimonas_sp.AAC.1
MGPLHGPFQTPEVGRGLRAEAGGLGGLVAVQGQGTPYLRGLVAIEGQVLCGERAAERGEARQLDLQRRRRVLVRVRPPGPPDSQDEGGGRVHARVALQPGAYPAQQLVVGAHGAPVVVLQRGVR